MNRLNIFNTFKSKSNEHEDSLTRNFLALIKNIPTLQFMFLNMIKTEMNRDESEKLIIDDLYLESIHTQISNSNQLLKSNLIENRNLVSVVISDKKYSTNESIRHSDRKAIYDGVIFCKPNWVIIIENKPFIKNIWLDQLNPNVIDQDISIIAKPCCLEWQDIISNINELISNESLDRLERLISEDFIEYIDNSYPELSPYSNFTICKNNELLLKKRCINAMSKLKIDNLENNVMHHRGWKYYVPSNKLTVKKIALDATSNGINWTIDLLMFVGDTMNSARTSYEKMDISKLEKLVENGFHVSKNFHVSIRSSNLAYFEGTLTIEEYINYWKRNYSNLRQIKKAEFENIFQNLKEDGIISESDYPKIDKDILSKNYSKLNICPGFSVSYSWTSQNA